MDHDTLGSGDRPPAEPPHGGRLIAASRAYPRAPQPWIDLSTGINPQAWPVPDLPPETWTRLPEPESLAALEHAAAHAYAARPGWQVVAAPGTSALIALLARLFPAPAAIVGPTYGEYRAAWPGALIVPGPAGLASRPVRIVCQPDNPTGTTHDPAALARLAAGDVLTGDRPTGDVLIADQSYADFVPGAALEPVVDAHPGLVVLRSFGKAYGLAGLRLGFALTAAATAARIRHALGPWPVSGPAIRIGTAALADTAWRAAAAARLQRDRARLDGMLAAAGFTDVSGTPLFSLARAGGPGWFGHLARHGILVRDFVDRPGWIRFGHPGTAPDWARLEAAFRSCPR